MPIWEPLCEFLPKELFGGFCNKYLIILRDTFISCTSGTFIADMADMFTDDISDMFTVNILLAVALDSQGSV